MNPADKVLIERIKTRPWRELPLCGVHVLRSSRKGRRKKDPDEVCLDISLAWLTNGLLEDEYTIQLTNTMDSTWRLELVEEMVAFARGAIPVAWGMQHRSELLSFVEANVPAGVDTTLCFLLRPKSRWLDPRMWTRVRSGKWHDLESVLKAAELGTSWPAAHAVAALAWNLPTRKGFPVKPDWTVRETTAWQELQEVF